jgi:hypothetical protein
MNQNRDSNLIEAPGQVAELTPEPIRPTPTASATVSAVSVGVPFDQVKHLLSEKPLRRPNRSKPIHSQTSS